MKTNTPASPPHKGYFLSHIHEQAHGHSSMRLLALAFDLVLIVLLIMLAVLLVLGQTWLVYHAVYAAPSFYLLAVCVILLYFAGFKAILGATPGKMLLLPWL